jgi:hypothetical protein
MGGHVARTVGFRNEKKAGLTSLNKRDHSEDLGVYGRIILKQILGKWGWDVFIGLIWLTTEFTIGILKTR